MRKSPEINNSNSMGVMLMLAIAMANGSNADTRYKQKRVLRNVAGLTANAAQSSLP
jgi:hypothetical protein